jgi:hypothetical protein
MESELKIMAIRTKYIAGQERLNVDCSFTLSGILYAAKGGGIWQNCAM